MANKYPPSDAQSIPRTLIGSAPIARGVATSKACRAWPNAQDTGSEG